MVQGLLDLTLVLTCLLLLYTIMSTNQNIPYLVAIVDCTLVKSATRVARL